MGKITIKTTRKMVKKDGTAKGTMIRKPAAKPMKPSKSKKGC